MEGARSLMFRRRPWSSGSPLTSDTTVGPRDSLIVEIGARDKPPRSSAPLPGLSRDGTLFHELALPGPRNPIASTGIPRRPRIGVEPKTPEEELADKSLDRMVRVLARVHELEFATDDPVNVWQRLDSFWLAAGENETLVSEIVRQSGPMPKLVERLVGRLRRVLRRERDKVPLDRIQEIDTGSLIWLTRRPGRTLAERAGPDQRIRAVVRRESFDTGENRVLHAWCRLAAAEARDWLRHNKRAGGSLRARQVERLGSRARRDARVLEELGVGVADPGVTPNFVLTQDPDYRRVYEAWLRLMREKREIDDLWAWQGRSWADFVALAVTLSIRRMDGAELVASCPLAIFADHDRGAWFGADVPLAVFHLRHEGLIVEVQYRPTEVQAGQDRLAAPLWLRIGGLAMTGAQRRVPVWPRLVFAPLDLGEEAADAVSVLASVDRRLFVSRGLIAVSDPNDGEARQRSGPVEAFATGIGPSGATLEKGMVRIGEFLRDELDRAVLT